MKVRGIAHVHSTRSFDGRLSLEQLRELAIDHGCRFVLLAEHVEGLTKVDLAKLIADCGRLSDERCALIPGLEIESQCQYFLGMRQAVDTDDTAATRRQLIDAGAFVVLAHPHRLRRSLSAEERRQIGAVEIWNVKDDGSRVPGYVGLQVWRDWRLREGADVAAIAGLDLHRREDWRQIGIEMDIERLETDAVLARLHEGAFQIWSGGKIFDPSCVHVGSRVEAYFVAALRSTYRKLRGRRQLLPQSVRRVLKRAIKG